MATQQIFNSEIISEDNLIYKKTGLLTRKTTYHIVPAADMALSSLLMEV
jgi:hypothetical protein